MCIGERKCQCISELQRTFWQTFQDSSCTLLYLYYSLFKAADLEHLLPYLCERKLCWLMEICTPFKYAMDRIHVMPLTCNKLLHWQPKWESNSFKQLGSTNQDYSFAPVLRREMGSLDFIASLFHIWDTALHRPVYYSIIWIKILIDFPLMETAYNALPADDLFEVARQNRCIDGWIAIRLKYVFGVWNYSDVISQGKPAAPNWFLVDFIWEN